MVNEFDGDYFFLSNHYESTVSYKGVTYKNNEAAFQAQKCFKDEDRIRFANLAPDEAKKLGRSITLRTEWEQIKLNEMYNIVKTKFTQNKALAEKLIMTGDEPLEDGNTRGDRIWGTVDGIGENNLGKILMRVRNEIKGDNRMNGYNFDAAAVTEQAAEWIRNWFDKNGKGCNAVIGISGGKDSSVAAALCVKALGVDRVIGVLMPNGIQSDIDMALMLVNHLKIKAIEVNIADAVNGVLNGFTASKAYNGFENNGISEQTRVNLPPRIRMSTLYAVSQSNNGRVVNTCNLSEDWVGYSTRYGDSAGDFSPLSQLTVGEVKQIGSFLGLPEQLVNKVPSDGLCGKTDEDNLGFTYAVLDEYIRTGKCADPHIKALIDRKHESSKFKLELMPCFEYKA